MAKKDGLFKRFLIGAGQEFRESPIRFGLGFLAIGITIFMFLGGVNLKVKHDDTEVHLSTQVKK